MSDSREQQEVIWGLADYAIFVPLSDQFYQTLNFERSSVDEFRSGDYKRQPKYNDSRTYLRPIVRHLQQYVGAPRILDVGGYIGRFSIESALLFEELGVRESIICFEPGDTNSLLRRNLELNAAANRVVCIRQAASNATGAATFAIKNDAMISSRIVSDATDMLKHLGPSWKKKTVTMVTLRDYILGGQLVDIEGDLGPADAFISKIDTEGHEAKVIEGIGSAVLEKMSHALIIEFWPSLLDETVDHVPFGTYALRNYIVYDVQSSLYPRSYDRVESFDGLVSRIHDREVSNIDLLMIRKSMPHLDILLAEIDALRQA